MKGLRSPPASSAWGALLLIFASLMTSVPGSMPPVISV